MTPAKNVRFGPFLFNPTTGQLQHENETLTLLPKDCAVLDYLVCNPGQIVSKSEFLENIWPDTVVSEDVLKTCIKRIRQKLGDDFKAPQYIETLHRRGYRFICAVCDEKSQKHSSVAPPVPHSYFVGREKELQELWRRFNQANRGIRQTVLITGEAGIGKSALIDIFEEHVRQNSAFLCIKGLCVNHHGPGEEYLPILDALADLCRSSAGELTATLLRHCAPMWLVQLPWLLTESERKSLQNTLTGTTPERMIRELVELLETLARESLLLMILEDLHWCDFATLDALSYLARRREASRLLILGTYRPVDVLQHNHPIRQVAAELGLQDNILHLPLKPLPEVVMNSFLARRFPDKALPDGLGKWLYRHSEGNPLFLNALIDHILSRGWLRADELILWNAPQEFGANKIVPATILQMIENQIDRLDKNERMMLEIGSIAGISFPTIILTADSEVDEEAAEAVCHRLARQIKIIQTDKSGQLPDGSTTTYFRFTHALYQKVIYESTPILKRQRLHQQIGELLEKLYGENSDKISAQLAMHFEKGLNFEKATAYRKLAAENALKRHAYREVISHAERGLKQLDDIADSPHRIQQEISLLILLGTALSMTQGYSDLQVEQIFSRAFDLSQQAYESPSTLPAIYNLWITYIIKADFKKAEYLGDRYYKLALRLNNCADLTWAYTMLCLNSLYQGKFRDAFDSSEMALQLYEGNEQSTDIRLYGVEPYTTILAHKAMTLWFLGYPDQSQKEMQNALALATDYSQPFAIVRILTYFSFLHLIQHDVSKTWHYADQAIRLSNEHGFTYYLSHGLVFKGWALVMQGNGQEGLELASQGIMNHQVAGAVLIRNLFLGIQAEALETMGRIDKGLELVDEALSLASKYQVRFYEADLRRIKGDLLSQKYLNSSQNSQAISGEAEKCYRQAIKVAGRQDAKSLELRACSNLSRLFIQNGEHSRARKLLKTIYGWFTEGFEKIDLINARRLLNKLDDLSESDI